MMRLLRWVEGWRWSIGARRWSTVRRRLVVIGRWRVAVHWHRRRGRRSGSEHIVFVKVGEDGEIGTDLIRRELPGRMVDVATLRWRFEVVTRVDDGARDETRVGFEDGCPVEGSRWQSVVVDEQRVVAHCESTEVRLQRVMQRRGSVQNGKVFSSVISCLSELWFSKYMSMRSVSFASWGW